MTAPVDVLAVMDAEIATSESLAVSDALHAEKLPKLRATRAAVAELIEAAGEVQEQFVALLRLHSEHSCYEMRDRLTAALANVGGAK